MKKIIFGLTLLSLTACATAPKKIAAQYVSPLQYKSYDCDTITMEQSRIERRTNELYHSLKKDASNDAWQMGVGLVLFWPVLFALEGGDGPEASEYARLKGEYEALRVNSVQRKCQLVFEEDLQNVVTDEKDVQTAVTDEEG